MKPAWIITALLIWFAAGNVVSFFARKKLGSGIPEYFLGGRRISGVIAAFTLSATLYSAFMMIGLVGLVYRAGIAPFGFESVYYISAILLMAVFVPRFWIAGKRYGYITASDLFAGRYENRAIAVIVGLMFIITHIPFTSVQLMGAGYLTAGLSNGAIPYWVGSMILGIIAFVYAWWAGMRSVAWTDALQGVVMLLTSFALLGFIWVVFFPDGMFNTIAASYSEKLRFTWGWSIWLGLTLPWMFTMLVSPHINQRFFIPKNVRAMRGMIVGFGVFGFVYMMLVVLFGLAANHIVPGLENADAAMPSMLKMVPMALGLIFAVGIFAASVSTVNSVVLTLSSIVGRDIYRALAPKISEEKELFWGKLLIPVMFVIAWVFAQFKFELIGILSTMSAGGLMSILPTLVGTFFWKRGTAAAVIISSIPSVIIIGSLYMAKLQPLGLWAPVWGLIVATVLYVIVSLMTKPPAKAEEFVAYTNNWQENARALTE